MSDVAGTGRDDILRLGRVEQIMGATDAAQAKWVKRVRDGMPVEQAIRAAYTDGVTDGLNLFGALSGRVDG